MSSQILAVQYLSVDSFRPDPKNPRLHSDRQIKQIARSIEVFGFNVPVLIDANSQLIAGHGRVLAAKRVGLTHVPTITLEHLTEAQIRAFRISDNRLTENSDWDDRLLGEQFKILLEAEIDFKLEVTGFETSEIDLFIENLAPASAGRADPDDVLSVASSIQVSRIGDLWGLGKHRILCADALSPGSYEALMDDQEAQLVFIDPISGYVSRFGKIDNPEFTMASEEMSETEFTKFLIKVFELSGRSSSDGALQFICTGWRHTPELLAAARQTFTEFINLCVWCKDAAGPGSLYRSQHELVFIFKNGKGPDRNNVQFGRHRTNVWRYPRVNSLVGTDDKGDLSNLQSTIKPVELVADAILDCTARGSIVLDPFLGSGSTLIAAERTDRFCYAMELEPAYVDTAVRRWQRYTGLTAIHEGTGESFAQREKEIADGCE